MLGTHSFATPEDLSGAIEMPSNHRSVTMVHGCDEYSGSVLSDCSLARAFSGQIEISSSAAAIAHHAAHVDRKDLRAVWPQVRLFE